MIPMYLFCDKTAVDEVARSPKMNHDAGPSQHLLVQNQQWKHQKNIWNLFKVNNKDTGTTSFDVVLASLLLTLNSVSIVGFE